MRTAITSARLRAALAICLVALSLIGCSGVGYYWQSLRGHMQMMNAARPVDEWINDAQTSLPLRTRLALARRIRSFAADELKLPDNASYHRYADLRRSAVVWNVVAAPEFSLTLKTWCFPVTGCVGYRGYFDEGEARAEAARLKAEGFETSVYGVPAYSTLGWMNWAGGDPLLNTFIGYPEGELARLIFHELAHQVMYVRDDTMFNESFATAVERLGSERWLATQASDEARAAYASFDGRRREFRALAKATRRELSAIYEKEKKEGVKTQADTTLASRKADAMQRFREAYARLRSSWNGFAGYDPWVANANNASFGAQAAYDELVPGFEALFEREGRDWQRFYDAVKKLASLSKIERHKALESFNQESPNG